MAANVFVSAGLCRKYIEYCTIQNTIKGSSQPASITQQFLVTQVTYAATLENAQTLETTEQYTALDIICNFRTKELSQ